MKRNNCLIITGKKQFNVTITKDLLDEYNKNNYADKQSVDRIALKVGLTSKQIHNWFQNKRRKLNETKNKQLKLKTTEELLEEYEINKCPNKQSLARIALKVGLSSKQVYYWFHYRRNKLKTNQFKFKIEKILLKEYEKNKYPDKQSKDKIASKVGLTSKKVSTWFQNGRQTLNETK